MIDLEFDAATVSVSNQDGALTVGLVDEPELPDKYLLLQRSLAARDQDRSLGQDTYYFEISGQDTSGYGGIAKASLNPQSLLLEFDPSKRCTVFRVLVHFDIPPSEWRKLSDALDRIFGNSGTRFVAN